MAGESHDFRPDDCVRIDAVAFARPAVRELDGRCAVIIDASQCQQGRYLLRFGEADADVAAIEPDHLDLVMRTGDSREAMAWLRDVCDHPARAEERRLFLQEMRWSIWKDRAAAAALVISSGVWAALGVAYLGRLLGYL